MKYGKEFQHILEQSDFPDDWKTSAIEYGKLKKLIKNVVTELEGMGLSPQVLQRLLVADGAAGSGSGPSRSSSVDQASPGVDEDFQFEFEVGDDPQSSRARSSSPRPAHIDSVFDDEEQEELPGIGVDASGVPHRFRVRLLSEASGEFGGLSPERSNSPGRSRPISVAEMLRSTSGGVGPDTSHLRSRSPVGSVASDQRGRIVTRAVAEGGVRAQYELGDEHNPVPHIRLHVAHIEHETLPSCSSSDPTTSESLDSMSMGNTEPDSDTEDEDDLDIIELSKDNQLLATPVLKQAPGSPASPSLQQLRSVASPIWALASVGHVSESMGELSLGEAATPRASVVDLTDDRTPMMAPAPAAISPWDDGLLLSESAQGGASITGVPVSSSPGDREFIIPLQSDVAFFNVLTAALTSLSEFHTAQQELFRESVDKLCRMISESIQPGDGVIVVPTPLNSSPSSDVVTKYEYKSSSPSQKDLYAWREIFSLWIESQIFESNAERDRGERSVEEAERRLKNFANEVVKRGLGDRRSLKGKRTRKAWEEFLRLNVLLLDLKRFRIANIEAARKILKKHDKRTALTASTGLASFVRQSLSVPVDRAGNVSMWTFYNTSLPHVLLASLTDTLLPILPSLDDYACLICMSIAFKPIRLTCGHLFCVRCLVKMQQRYKENCPLCRQPTVLSADKSCLDVSLMNFMRDWFPREVKDKQRENTSEIAQETMQDAGLDTRCTVQ